MRIGKLATLIGYSRDWIRRQERLGILPPASLDRNGHRRYSEEALNQLKTALYHLGTHTIPEHLDRRAEIER